MIFIDYRLGWQSISIDKIWINWIGLSIELEWNGLETL